MEEEKKSGRSVCVCAEQAEKWDDELAPFRSSHAQAKWWRRGGAMVSRLLVGSSQIEAQWRRGDGSGHGSLSEGMAFNLSEKWTIFR